MMTKKIKVMYSENRTCLYCGKKVLFPIHFCKETLT